MTFGKKKNIITLSSRKEVKGISIFRKEPSARQTNYSQASKALPKAVAFVDYEHWYISMKNNFGLQPDIKGWFEDLNSQFNLVEVSFFADFSHKSLSDEIRRIRLYSNKIIDTRSPNGVKKDYTDFIILDNIYQKALSSDDIEVFILFSGDGHFSSVTSFLKNFYRKQVVIYGVKDSFSRSLQETASRVVVVPTERELYGSINKLVFKYLKESSQPTSSDAVAVISKENKSISKQQISLTIKNLMDNNYISERSLSVRGGGKGKKQNNLFVDWDKVEMSGLLAEE